MNCAVTFKFGFVVMHLHTKRRLVGTGFNLDKVQSNQALMWIKKQT